MKITPVLRPRINKKGEKPVYLRLANNTDTKYVSLALNVKPSAWNKNEGKLRKNDYYNFDAINKIISDKVKQAEDKYYQLRAEGKSCNPDILKKYLSQESSQNGDFFIHADEYVESFNKQGSILSWKRYKTVVDKLKEYTQGKLSFEDITHQFLTDYSDWLYQVKQNKPMTAHGNLRAIRAILYRAIHQNKFPQSKNPFFHFKLKSPKTNKEKLSFEEIKKLEKAKPKKGTRMYDAQLSFLFAFYCAGIRFGDLAKLKWENIQDEWLKYTMGKTGLSKEIPLVPKARAILKKYKKKSSKPDDFVFPFLNKDRDYKNPKILANDISSKNALINSELKDLCDLAKVKTRVSFHIARHSFSDLARQQGMDLYAVSKLLGHSSLKVTESYLNSFDRGSFDQYGDMFK